MASLSDLILQQVTSSASSVQIPSNMKDTVLNGLSSSILGSLTQTAASAGGIDQIKSLLTGKANAATSPVTALAGNFFSKNILSGLKLDNTLKTSLTALIPTVIGKLGNIFTDKDGDGDVDLNDILLTLKGGSSATSSVLGAATSILGGFLKKR